jgi:hypothetical protein
MVNNNGIPFEVKKPVETVYELKNEVPCFEEFMKTYESDGNVNYDDLNSGSIGEVKGYGPCKKDGCDCSCKWDSCSCRWCIETQFGESGCERYGFTKNSGKAKARWFDDGKFRPSGELEINNSISAVASKSGDEEARFFGISSGGSVSASKDEVALKGKLGIDAYNYKDEDKEVRIGLNVDTGVKFDSDGAEFKLAGFGFSANNDQIGISTPLFEAKCAVQ